MGKMKLSNGGFCKIDDKDIPMLSKYKWMKARARNNVYAVAWVRLYPGRKQVKMHRIILNVNDPKIWVDHKDGNGLNNTRDNIRLCTPSQNKINTQPRGKSKYIGVYPTKSGTFRAGIVINKKYKHIGTYRTEIEAATSRDECSIKYHGEFARLNFRK